MSDVLIYGIIRSTYVRSARWALEEKGVPYRLVAPGEGNPLAAVKEAPHLARHPFGKIPALEHGAVTLYETAAITQYTDEAFEGPALQPSDVLERAEMRQWISVANSYLDPALMGAYVFNYVRANMEPEKADIEPALPQMDYCFKVLDQALEGRDYLAADHLTLAEIIIAPMAGAAAFFPEGKELMAQRPALRRALKLWTARESFKAAGAEPAKAA